MTDKYLAIFRGQEVRREIYNNEWWFSVVDSVRILTDSVDAGAYWRKLKQRLIKEGSQVVTFCHGLKLKAPDGKKLIVEIPRPFSVLSSLSLPLKQSRSKDGLQESGMKECKR